MKHNPLLTQIIMKKAFYSCRPQSPNIILIPTTVFKFESDLSDEAAKKKHMNLENTFARSERRQGKIKKHHENSEQDNHKEPTEEQPGERHAQSEREREKESTEHKEIGKK
jgi:hypothetical protein